jgi:hypothetical protein
MFLRLSLYLLMAAAVAAVAMLGKPERDLGVPMLAVAILGGGLFLQYRSRVATTGQRISPRGTAIVLLMLALGMGTGWLLPTFGLRYFPLGLVYALAVFCAFALPETLVASRVPPRYLSSYRLSGAFFPFFSLGVVVLLVLRMRPGM